jgi:hypothetical protein
MALLAFYLCVGKIGGTMFGVGSISKFLTISEFEWQHFKDSVDQLRSSFPGLHQESENADRIGRLYSDMGETRLMGSKSWREVTSA